LLQIYENIKTLGNFVKKMDNLTPEQYKELLKSKGKRGASWKAQWCEIGGIRKYYRSKWEKNYALYLEWLKGKNLISDWKHEAKTFWFDNIKRGTRSYLPDFEVYLLNGEIEYHEVKGYLDPKSQTKLKRMAKYYPDVKMRLIDKEWFAQNAKKLKTMILGWD
jgi:hypothetical protein